MFTTAILFALLSPSADVSPIRLPPISIVVPTPMPQANTDSAVKLTADLLYVIDSDVPVVVLDSPRGRVAKTFETGPVKIRAKFVGGSGKVETKTFTGKHVVSVEASHTGPVELLIVPVGAAVEADVKRVSIEVDAGEGPRPPPDPKTIDPIKPEPPKPVENTNPFGADDDTLRVLWVYDASKAHPADQFSAMFAKSVESYLSAKKAKYRRYQPSEDGSKDDPAFSSAAKSKRDSVPWVYVGRGKSGVSVECPANPAGMLALLKKYGGE